MPPKEKITTLNHKQNWTSFQKQLMSLSYIAYKSRWQPKGWRKQTRHIQFFRLMVTESFGSSMYLILEMQQNWPMMPEGSLFFVNWRLTLLQSHCCWNGLPCLLQSFVSLHVVVFVFFYCSKLNYENPCFVPSKQLLVEEIIKVRWLNKQPVFEWRTSQMYKHKHKNQVLQNIFTTLLTSYILCINRKLISKMIARY